MMNICFFGMIVINKRRDLPLSKLKGLSVILLLNFNLSCHFTPGDTEFSRK